MSKNLRVTILLLILAAVTANEYLARTRSTSWEHPLWVRVYAVNGDGGAATDKYINTLTSKEFVAIEKFVNREAIRYGITIGAIDVEYGGRLDSHPPQPPSGQSILENIWWSLKFRFWSIYRSWTSDNNDGDVELYVSYYDIENNRALRHSVGLKGGMIGIINAFAHRTYRGSNNVVITHELMHTLGAIDKYDNSNLPLHPEGYVEPYRDPLYPQRMAEIMGGRIPLSPLKAKMPQALAEVAVGTYTAAEINWKELGVAR